MAEQMRYMNMPAKNIRRRRLLVLVPIILLIAFYFIGFRATAVKRGAENFSDKTSNITKQSNFLGKQFRTALNTSAKSKFLSESLDNMVEESLTLSEKASAIEPPEDLKLAHSFFSVAMKLRHQGLEKYSRITLTAFSAKATKQSEEEALKDLSLSDAAYKYYLQETNRYLNSHDLKITLTKSAFITNTLNKKIAIKKKPAKPKPKKKEEEKKTTDGDLSIDDVATIPLRVSFNPDNNIRVLPDTTSVDIRVRIDNKGAEVEEDVPVEVELLNDNKTISKKQGSLNRILAGKQRRITIRDFKPKKDGVNIFKVTVGNPSTENNSADNSYEYKFIFKSQD